MSEQTEPLGTKTETPPALHRPRRWLNWLLMLVLFLSGLGIGAGGTLIVVRNRILQAFHHPEKAPRQIAERLRSRLNLSDTQASQVEAIVRTHQVELRKIRRAVQPRVEEQLTQVEEEIGRVLDDGQRVKWHEIIAYLRKVWIPARPTEADTPSR